MKKWKTKCAGKVVKHGAKGYKIGKVGSVKQKSYCARSLGITRKFPSARKPCSPNYLSRRKWGCKVTKLEK
jgi:hypothetical protein